MDEILHHLRTMVAPWFVFTGESSDTRGFLGGARAYFVQIGLRAPGRSQLPGLGACLWEPVAFGPQRFVGVTWP